MALSTLHLAPSVQRLMASPLDKPCRKQVETVQSVLKVMTERRGPHSEGLMAAARTRHNLASCRLGQEQGKGCVACSRPPRPSIHRVAFSMWHARRHEVGGGGEQPLPAQEHKEG